MRPLSPRDPSAVAQLAGAAVGARPRSRSRSRRRSTPRSPASSRTSGDTRVRRGRRTQGGRLRRHTRSSGALRPVARVRHAARRDEDPRPCGRHVDLGLRPDPRDPVPRIPPQRRGPAARRGGDAPVLLAGRVSQRDGRADPGLRLPEGVRRPLPQRQRGGRAAGHSRPRRGVTCAAGRRGRDAPHLRRCREGGRQRLRVPRADRAVPHPRPPRGGRRALAGCG